ncbi:MAG: DUF1194 domain-containing protein [Rubrivivax sp.]
MRFKQLAAAAALVAGSALGTAQAVPVALELSLVIDVSGSIDANEYNLQAQGYKNAFLDATVQANIMSFADGIAVNVIQFSDNAVQVINWTHLTDAASITAFANAIGAMARSSSGGTDVEDGMSLGINSFNNNGYEGARKVMDVSGDGEQNTDPACAFNAPNYNQACANVQTQRNAAQAAGIRINGLAIEGAVPSVNAITNWYTANVITAGGSIYTATGFNTFETAVIAKIGQEIINVPEPGSLALVGLALAGFGLASRRRQS